MSLFVNVYHLGVEISRAFYFFLKKISLVSGINKAFVYNRVLLVLNVSGLVLNVYGRVLNVSLPRLGLRLNLNWVWRC